jgi:hypothetical protein
VRRDCFGCGHTCISCKELFIRTCGKCNNEYCREDNDASSDTLVSIVRRNAVISINSFTVRLVQLYFTKDQGDVLSLAFVA